MACLQGRATYLAPVYCSLFTPSLSYGLEFMPADNPGPWACGTCDLTFYESKTWNRHQYDAHTETLTIDGVSYVVLSGGKYRCPITGCDKTYQGYTALRKHVKRGHDAALTSAVTEGERQKERGQDFHTYIQVMTGWLTAISGSCSDGGQRLNLHETASKSSVKVTSISTADSPSIRESGALKSIDPEELTAQVRTAVKESVAEGLAKIGLTEDVVKLLIAAASLLSDPELSQRSFKLNGDPGSAEKAPARTATDILATTVPKRVEVSDTHGHPVGPVSNAREKSLRSIGEQELIGEELPPSSFSASQLTSPPRPPKPILPLPLSPTQLYVNATAFKAPSLDDPVNSSPCPDFLNRSALRPAILTHRHSFDTPVTPPSSQTSLGLPDRPNRVANLLPQALGAKMSRSDHHRQHCKAHKIESPRPLKRIRRSLTYPEYHADEDKDKEAPAGAGADGEEWNGQLSDSEVVVRDSGSNSSSSGPPVTFTLEDEGGALTWSTPQRGSRGCGEGMGGRRVTGGKGGESGSGAVSVRAMSAVDQVGAVQQLHINTDIPAVVGATRGG